jgi:hypothetical protein
MKKQWKFIAMARDAGIAPWAGHTDCSHTGVLRQCVDGGGVDA